MNLRLHSLFFCVLAFVANAAPPLSGQYEIKKRRADGLYDAYGITLTDGQVIGQLGGVPAAVSPGSSPAWGSITGTLTDQTDLGTALNAKLATTVAASTYEPIITAGISAQYWRGDKSWQTLNAAAVGLGNVENTALSTWAGTASITTLGSVGTGTWEADPISVAYGGTGANSASAARTNLGLGALAVKSTIGPSDIAFGLTAAGKIVYIVDGYTAGVLALGTGLSISSGTLNISATESQLSFSDVTTANVSTAKHGLMPKLNGASNNFFGGNGAWNAQACNLVVACSDETTDLTTGTAKVTFRMPNGMNLISVRANVNTAPGGSSIIIDVKESGTTVFSTQPAIAAGNKSTQASGSTVPILSDTSLADDAEITIDITQVGTSPAGKGLKVTLIGTLP